MFNFIKRSPSNRHKVVKREQLTSTDSFIETFWSLLMAFLAFLLFYFRKKLISSFLGFEKNKNLLVKFFMMKRGRYNRPFLHITAMIALGIGVVIAPFLADTYPIFSAGNLSAKLVSANVEAQSIGVDNNVFKTSISDKPRDKVVTYAVEKGDTISTIAKKFGISEETVKWTNDLTNDNLAIGDELKILPVTGMLHKVSKGDTVYTIAKKYDTNPQQIVDFPFNDFANPETFSLVEGQMLVVPDGVKPEEKAPTIRRQTYIVSGPVTFSAGGFAWPTRAGSISQYAAWYHMAIDIAAPYGTPLIAAKSGKVIRASSGTWDSGYGTNLTVDHGNGYQTHYAHMSGFNVSLGDSVEGGKTVLGWIGMTGRTTGPHVHFELFKNGALVNPLSFLQ